MKKDKYERIQFEITRFGAQDMIITSIEIEYDDYEGDIIQQNK